MSFLGDRIRTERKWAGMTSKALAERVRLSPRFMNDIEHGRRYPSVADVLAIANQFPDADSTWWLWLLLTDLWGPEIAALMRKHASHSGAFDAPRPALECRGCGMEVQLDAEGWCWLCSQPSE